MTHPLHSAIAAQLDRLLRDPRVVMFYDPRHEFAPFIAELDVVGTGRGDLPRACIHDTLTHLARFEGSWFSLKLALEPVVELDRPEPLLVYLPGVARDHTASVLMELDQGGACYEPQLRRLARRELRCKFTDGDIDGMLAPESLSYQDVVQLLRQEGGPQTSLVKLVLGEGPSETLIARWLATEAFDEALSDKQASPELYRLLQARLGLTLDPATPLPKARHQALRYVLVGEFRSDLTGAPPATLAVVPAPATKEERQRLRDLAAQLRGQHASRYAEIADGLEAELSLAQADIDPARLGRIDTFRFEERRLLDHAAQLLLAERCDEALQVVEARSRSFWVDHDLGRLAQWEVCRLIAELGRQIQRVRPLVARTTEDPRAWVEAYATSWFEADRAHRALEAWVAKMDEEPESALEQALGLVRRSHEALLEEMAHGFSRALAQAGWHVPGLLHQTQVFSERVDPVGGRVALFLVDALRFEMGADLLDQLEGCQELRLVPALAALPTITPVGMAALLPGASASFSVVEHKDKLAARIGDSVLPGQTERMKHLKALRPDAKDIDLGELLQGSVRSIEKRLAAARIVVVRSQSIDGLGEVDSGLLARQIMDTVVANVARAVRKLARIGIESFIVTADHGHQFSIRKDEDMTMDKPGGDTVDLHRRCWAGRGGQTPAAGLRVTSTELGYPSNLDFIFPKGLAVFRTGGDLAYHHGGISLQEAVVPVVSLRIPGLPKEPKALSAVTLEGCPPVLTNRTFGLRVVSADLLAQEPLAVRLVLLAEGQEVGRAGMALDAELDRATGTVKLPPRQAVSIGMMLTRDEFKRVRVVAQEPATDAILAQTDEIDVKLGM